MLFTYDCMMMPAHFDVLAQHSYDDASRCSVMTQMMSVATVHLQLHDDASSL
jgi:hypothetical protein